MAEKCKGQEEIGLQKVEERWRQSHISIHTLRKVPAMDTGGNAKDFGEICMQKVKSSGLSTTWSGKIDCTWKRVKHKDNKRSLILLHHPLVLLRIQC